MVEEKNPQKNIKRKQMQHIVEKENGGLKK